MLIVDRKNVAKLFLTFVALIMCLTLTQKESVADDDNFAQHKIVIQSSSSDPELQGLALIIAGNLQKHYGMDKALIEVVAYGPGLGILTQDSPHAEKVKSLIDHDIKFSACEGTLKFIESQNNGKRPDLVKGVGTVKDGVVRVVELQEKGYAYVYPR